MFFLAQMKWNTVKEYRTADFDEIEYPALTFNTIITFSFFPKKHFTIFICTNKAIHRAVNNKLDATSSLTGFDTSTTHMRIDSEIENY